MKIEENVKNKIESKVQELGFEIEYVEFVKEGENHILRIVLDKPGQTVDVDDCEKVSRFVENDVDALITKEYILEVSSPGVERQLKNMNLYQKYIGSEIFVKLFQKINNQKELQGILEDVNVEENTICVKLESGESLTIALSQISSAHTVYDFASALKEKDPVNLNQLNKFNKK